MMRNDCKPWSEGEISTLCQLYPLLTASAIRERLPQRSVNAIRRKADNLMLCAHKDITEELEHIRIMRDSGMTVAQISETMGYTRRTIFRRMKDLKES
jgi:CRP-like cAMP-binding protein